MINLFHRFSGSLIPLAAAMAALAIGAIVIMVLGANPLLGYGELVKGAFGSGDALADTAVRAMPLLLVGTGICIAFRASVINIGGEGQIVAGALLSTITRVGRARPPSRSDHPSRDARRGRRRRDLGSYTGRAQGLPRRQRDPLHHHVEHRGHPGDELSSARPLDRPPRGSNAARAFPRRSASRRTPTCRYSSRAHACISAW